jgi:hypothetical protein
LQHPKISIEMALWSGGSASVDARYHIAERDTVESADFLDLICEIENNMFSGKLNNWLFSRSTDRITSRLHSGGNSVQLSFGDCLSNVGRS